MKYLIGDVAKQTGLSTHTLRYYEKEGLISGIDRKANGLRAFTEGNIEWLNVIRCLKDTGMSIANIKNYVELCKNGKNTVEMRKEIFIKQQEHIKEQIGVLNKHLEIAEYKIWYYDNIEKLGDENDPLNCEKMKAIYKSRKME